MTHSLKAEFVDEVFDAGVLRIELKSGPAHPLSLGMIRALHTSVIAAADNDLVGVIVIHGPGRIFCAGHDLKEIASHRSDDDQGRGYLNTLFNECSAMMQALVNSPKPTIALVEGLATAGGLQLVASCDLAFASEQAAVCLPGVSMGGFCTTPAVAVARKLPRNTMMELALSSETYNADWARQAGLFNRVTHADNLITETMAFAKTLATRNPQAIALGKQALLRQVEMPLDEAYIYATDVMIEHFMDPTQIANEQAKWAKS